MHVAALFLTVYHYQVKIHFTSKVDRSEMEPSITVSLYGTKGEAENLELKLWVSNTTPLIKEKYNAVTCELQKLLVTVAQ